MSVLVAPVHLAAPVSRDRVRSPTWARIVWRERSLAALAGLVLVIFGTLIAVLVASLIGPFIMFALPLIMLFGFALGPLHAMVRGEI